jgi:microcystin-dependent protein
MRRSLILVVFAVFMAAVPAHAQGDQFVGQIDIVAFNFAPEGWAFCQGQLMPISENPALFELIGTTYGGDGQDTFALPDLRGRMAIHQGQGPGLSNYVMGQVGGVEQVTLTLNQIPSHTHTAMGSSAPATTLGPGSSGGSEWATTTTFLYSSTGSNLVAMGGGTIGAAGGGQPHDNMPPYLVMNFIISLFGIFPSQN